jgi:hypothetical protein
MGGRNGRVGWSYKIAQDAHFHAHNVVEESIVRRQFILRIKGGGVYVSESLC